MSKTKKIAILAIIAMVLTMLPVSLFAATTSDRIYGEGRVETALEIAGAGWSSTTVAVLAAADQANLVDALAAAGLAGQEEAPILLTFKDSLDPAVKAKLVSLGVNKVYVIGAISDAVAEEVDAMTNVSIEVLKGVDRWATAQAVNAKLTNPAGTFVVGYNALPDALSVASYAAKNKYAIVLAGVDGKLPSGQATVGSNVYVVGGSALVADISGTTRIAGADRFETNKKVAETLGFDYSKVYVANGMTGLVDALSVAPLAAQSGSFVALANGNSVAAASYVNEKITAATQVIALGGPTVVSDTAKGKIAYGTSEFVVESLKALSASQLEIKFSKAVDKASLVSNNALVPAVEITRLPSHGGLKDVTPVNMYASLSADGLTLTLGTDYATGEYFDGTYAIYIPAGVTSKAYGEDLGAYRAQFSVNDKTAPEVVSVTYNSATDQFEVVMSEICSTDPAITVDGANQSLTQSAMGTKYTFDNDWDRGEIVTVKVTGAVDFKDNAMENTYSKDVKVIMDETALAVSSVTQGSSNMIKVVFNKAIAGSTDEERANMVWGAVQVFRSGVPVGVDAMNIDADNSNDGVRVDGDDSSKRTYKIYLDSTGAPNYDFYNGKTSATLTVVFGEDELNDVFGNTNNEISKTVAMTKDSTGPKIVSLRVSSSDEDFVVRFDEDVNIDDGNKLLVRQGGIDVSVDFTTTASGKEITFAYGSEIPNGEYTIRIDKDAISDDHGNLNAAQYKTYTISSATNPITTTISDSGLNDNEYVITFSAPVASSALELSNYTLNGSALPSNADVYFSNSNKQEVTIQLASGSVNYNNSSAVLRVSKVKDADGVTIDSASDTVIVVDNTRPTLKSATLAGNVLTLTFDENMYCDAADLSEVTADLEIKGGTTTLNGADAAATVSVDGKKVYITVTAVNASNWNTVKAYSKITIKTLDGSTYFGDDLSGALQNSLKKDVTVTVVKL